MFLFVNDTYGLGMFGMFVCQCVSNIPVALATLAIMYEYARGMNEVIHQNK